MLQIHPEYIDDSEELDDIRAYDKEKAQKAEPIAFAGKILKNNPDLSFDFVQEILLGQEEANNSKLTPYEFKK